MFCLNNWDAFHNPAEKDCSPGVDAAETVRFSWKVVEPQGQCEHDVRVSRLTPWMASVGGPVMMRTAVSLFNRKFAPGDATSRRDVPFAAGVRGVYDNPTLQEHRKGILTYAFSNNPL